MSFSVAHLSTARTWRGGEAQVLELARGTLARGHGATVLCPPGAPLADRARAAGLPVRTVRVGAPINFLGSRRLAAALERLGPSVLHVHDGHGVTHGARAVRRVAVPYFVIHRRVAFRISNARKYAEEADHVICISEAVRDVLRSAGVPLRLMTVVHDGINPDPPPRSGTSFRAEIGLPESAPLLVQVGRLSENKGQRDLLHAMPRVLRAAPDANLALVGDGEDEPHLRALARRLGVESSVRFLGFREDVPRIAAAADLYVAPSHAEGLNTSALQAMAVERAVVCTDAGGLPEVVVDGETGRVVPVRSPPHMAEAIVELLADAERRARFGRAGRARVLDCFTVDAMVDGVLAVYRRLLPAAPAAPARGPGA